MNLKLHEEAAPGLPAGPTGGEPTRLQPQHREPAEPQIDPATYAALVSYYQQTAEFVEPLLQDEGALGKVRRYVGDKDFRSFVDESDKFYEESRRRSEPDMPAWAKRLADDINETRTLVNDKIIKPREDEQSRAQQAYAAQQTASARDLMEKHNLDLPMLRAVAAYGDQLGIRDINDAWKHYSAALNKDKPPASLRAAASEPGVPGPSGNPKEPPKDRNDLARRLANNLRSVRAS